MTEWEGILVILAMTCHPIVHTRPVCNMIHHMRTPPHLQMKEAVTEHLVEHIGINEVIELITVIIVKDNKHQITDRIIHLILLTRIVGVDMMGNHKDHPMDKEKVED
jgi:hypothetical protein